MHRTQSHITHFINVCTPVLFLWSGLLLTWYLSITANILAEFYYCGFNMQYPPWAHVLECLIPKKCAVGEVLGSKEVESCWRKWANG